ncbi:hypothetical protein Rsub_01121 [Raphidocelis subcapitata]|uniref:Uncharacterized protein n=1 Tax=Raphidocelis subcapitata TaxID=307507 RepID=A0A2V0NMN4_9CHLO|nr:hypothetical protein Rsub_01121 [Raphidocelis subcapitata]|eukprot:GBF88409.1 hypothetical protein Rsub_01121 [Raphidocelis subcapitata]
MERAPDDVLTLLFVALLESEQQGRRQQRRAAPTPQRQRQQRHDPGAAAAPAPSPDPFPPAEPSPGHFMWLRTSLPLVCKRWAALLRSPSAVFGALVVDARAEATAARRAGTLVRNSADLGLGHGGSHGGGGGVREESPDAGSPPFGASPPPGSSPMRGGWVGRGSPPPLPLPAVGLGAQHATALAHRPHSTAAAGTSPPARAGGLHHSASSSRTRARLSSRRVLAWLVPRAGAVCSLSLDLTGPHDFTGAALERGMALLAPTLTHLRLAGAPADASDCCEAMGLLRRLRSLRVSGAAPSVLGSGLMHLAFLPGLAHLSLALDLPPACPEVVRDFPTALRSLSLANAWLAALPLQLHDLKGLTSVTLDRCALESDPLPLLLSLRGLREVEIRAPPGGRSHELPPNAAAPAAPSVERVALVECGLSRAPPVLCALTALTALDLSHNPEMGAAVAAALPEGLTALTALADLALAHCGLGQLPPVASELAGLTRLELAGNPLASLPRRPLACLERLAVLGLAGTRLKVLPAWMLEAAALRELSLSAACLAGPPPGGVAVSTGRSGAGVSAALGALSLGASAASGAGGPPLQQDAPLGTSGWLRQLPEQLPGLQLLSVEGALWEQAAVRNVIALLARGPVSLRLELLP